VKERGKKKQ